MIIELQGGTKVFFGGEAPEIGLAPVGRAGDIAKISGEKFQAALGSLADLVSAMEKSIGKMASRPDKLEMEFGASLSGDCNLWIVSGEGKAEFKVKLAWEAK